MFKFFLRMIARTTELSGKSVAAQGVDSQNSDEFARLDSDVPLNSAINVHHSFVHREAVLNSAEKIAGYEFSLLTSLQTRTYRGSGTLKRAYDDALLTRLSSHGVPSLVGRRLAFINLSAESLRNALIDQLPPQNTVLIFDTTEQTTNREDLLVRLAEIRERGFALGLAHIEGADTTFPLVGNADFIEIDVTDFDGLNLRTLIRNLKKMRPAGKAPPQLVARNVQSRDDFQFCNKCGFDLFEGPFISSRESFRPISGGINHMAVLHIVSMVLGEQAFSSIAEQLKNEQY